MIERPIPMRKNAGTHLPCSHLNANGSSTPKRRMRKHLRRRGVSLLEVILAIAILGIALMIIGELIRIGFRSASEARLRSEAQMACDTKMAEIVAGAIALESANGVSIEESPEWVYDVSVEQAAIDGLLLVKVTVRQADADDPMIFDVSRFMPDPDYDPSELQQ